MKEKPRKRIKFRSSLNKISSDKLGKMVGLCGVKPHPYHSPHPVSHAADSWIFHSKTTSALFSSSVFPPWFPKMNAYDKKLFLMV
jgi:hypothetical protein